MASFRIDLANPSATLNRVEEVLADDEFFDWEDLELQQVINAQKKRREAALARLAAASPSPQRLLGQVEALIPDLTPKPSAPLSPLIAPGSSIEGVGLSFCFE